MHSPLAVTPELLARAADEAAGALFITDLEHRFVWVNAAFERCMGYRESEVRGQVPSLLLGANDPTVSARIVGELDQGEPVSADVLFRRKDGSLFWAALAVTPIRDHNGTAIGYLSNCIDISTAKTAERRLANIIAGTRAATWEWNVQTGTVRFNERWAEIVGYTLDELQPVTIETWMRLAHPDDLRGSAAQLERHFTGQSEFYECLCRMRHRHGHDVWVHDRGQVVEWTSDGKPLMMVGTHIDVTEMVRTSEALREARDRAEHVLNTVQSVIISLDRDGHVLQINPAGCELVGATEAQIVGRNWFREFHPPEHIDDIVGSYADLMYHDGPELPFTENEIVTMAGTRRLLRWRHVVQKDDDGRPCGLLSSGDDITELRQLERMAARRQRLESIGTLAGGIAHDLNNALSPAVMGMGLLREAAPREGVLIDMIESSTKRAAQMVRQLLAFARGVDGDRRNIDVPVVVREVERLVRTTFPKNVSLSVEMAAELPPVVGDATQLHQILVNLAVNARDAMTQGGLLALSVQPVEVTAEEASRISLAAARAGRFVRFTVRDSGEGISPQLLDRIFDPFFTTKGPERGTGLGLSTVLGIVKGHGGFVQVESRPGIGSAFHVFLPTTEQAARPELPTVPDESATPGGLVLFVDDEPFIRSMVTMLARRIGFVATTAGSTDEALAILGRSAHSIAAVVTDLHMPGRDGMALAREVRARWPDMPVVIVSGLMTDDLWHEVRQLSNVAVLPKPFSEKQLRQVLEQGSASYATVTDSPRGT